VAGAESEGEGPSGQQQSRRQESSIEFLSLINAFWRDYREHSAMPAIQCIPKAPSFSSTVISLPGVRTV
jgi:hypothetical protein